MANIRKPQAPRLPDPPVGEAASYYASLLNALRLFFNQLIEALSSLLGPFGGRFLSIPAGKFISVDTQTAASITEAYPITFETVDLSLGVNVIGTPLTTVTVDHAGWYEVVTEAHFSNNVGTSHEAGTWLVLNGTPVPNSKAFSTVASRSGDDDGQTLLSRTSYLLLVPGDELQAFWSTTSLTVALQYIGTLTSPTRPAAPSAIVFVRFVSSTQGA